MFFVMKKILVLAAALCLTAGLYAQKREGNVVKVQGHVHELLTKQAAGKEAAKVEPRTPVGSVYNINPADIQCWVGCVDTSLAVDTAYLLVKWTDGKALDREGNDSILIWGYLWNPPEYLGKCSIDMIRAVANFDCRFSTLLQNTGAGNFTVGGFGYNFDEDVRLPIYFDSLAANLASKSGLFQYHYVDHANCPAPYNQFALPGGNWAPQAIEEANNTGVIKHPFDAAYSYPAYDYDFWKLQDKTNIDFEWQAGWYYGYWSFNIREGLSGPFTYPTSDGIATQPLNNNSVHYFVFASADYNVPPNLDGEYSSRECCKLYCSDCAASY
jgi:hypothetical protein